VESVKFLSFGCGRNKVISALCLRLNSVRLLLDCVCLLSLDHPPDKVC